MAMNNQETLLDDNIIRDASLGNTVHLVGGTIRFINYCIDTVIVAFFSLIMEHLQVLGVSGHYKYSFLNPNFIITSLFYYTTLEYLFKKTLGKHITKTMVVSKDGRLPTFLDILIRSFCRHIPFEALSFFGHNVIGWHDSLSKTLVVRPGFKKLF